MYNLRTFPKYLLFLNSGMQNETPFENEENRMFAVMFIVSFARILIKVTFSALQEAYSRWRVTAKRQNGCTGIDLTVAPLVYILPYLVCCDSKLFGAVHHVSSPLLSPT